MQNPSQPSAIAEYSLATSSINGSSPPVTRDQYPKILWRPKYSYTNWIPFNTYSSRLQMQSLGGSCWVHFLRTGKTHFQTGFSPACSVCPEQIPRKVATWHLLLDSKQKPCTHNVPCLGRTQYRKLTGAGQTAQQNFAFTSFNNTHNGGKEGKKQISPSNLFDIWLRLSIWREKNYFPKYIHWNASVTEPPLVGYAEALTSVLISDSEELVNYLSLKLIPN